VAGLLLIPFIRAGARAEHAMTAPNGVEP